MTALFSKRLPHVLGRKDLALVLASTYAQSERVAFEEAQDRMERALSAAMVMLNLEIGQAPEMMRNALETPKGQELLREGLRALGAHLVGELIK